MKTRVKNFFGYIKDKYNWLLAISGIGMLMPDLLMAETADDSSDYNTLAHPIIIMGKLIMVIVGLIYLILGTLWIWLPAIVIFAIRKKHAKREEERGEEHTKDMLIQMAIGGLGSVVVSFIIIGAFGMTFFKASTLTAGIQAYYGNIITNIQSFAQKAFGV